MGRTITPAEAPPTFCRQCGKMVGRYREDFKFTDGGVWKRKGHRTGSLFMVRHDHRGRFCTVRCAALWAIARAPVPS
jgi:hypothetical protein